LYHNIFIIGGEQLAHERLGIETGDEIVFEVYEGKVILKKKGGSAENFKKYVGFLSHLKGKKADDIVAELRGKADDYSH
jgi:bifunctional DNA-binding transcriptional regulator/antitoxin component of YhaV-PrlF toxin-antitoxin module